MSERRSETAIVVLAGPTGVGKTRLAVELCRRLEGEIVGADSVQVYRGFDIGSGKPSAQELAGVRHHLIDVLDADAHVDAARFAALADQAIADICARGRLAVVAGGTGLWLRALLRGLVQLPPVDPALRARLEHDFRTQGAQVLHRRLAQVDPRTAAVVHESDMVRVVRALEVHEQTGAALGELRARHALGAPRYRALTLVVDLPPERWQRAVAERTRDMFARGFVAEVRGLIDRYGPHIKPLRAVGYRQVAAGLALGSDEPAIEREVLRATRLYGRRQRTWFRGDPSVDMRVDADALLAPDLLERIRDHVRARR